MKRLLIYLMLLAFALPNAIAGEKTVTISRNEGIYDDGTGTFIFDKEKMTITWKDDKEDAGKDVQFVMDFNANKSEDGSEDGYDLMEGEMLDEPGEDFPEEDESTNEGPDEEFMSEDADY